MIRRWTLERSSRRRLVGEKMDGGDLILVNFEKRVREDEIVDAVHLRICLEFRINIEENLYKDDQQIVIVINQR